MRVTCPNCAVRYQVADAMIAPQGQHVQCTACHTRWFERPAAQVASASFGEDEIIARLEARGGRGTRPAGQVGEGASVAPHQNGADFLWEGGAAPGEGRRPGPRLRLVTEAPDEESGTEDQDETALEAVAAAEGGTAPGMSETTRFRSAPETEEGAKSPRENEPSPDQTAGLTSRAARQRLDLGDIPGDRSHAALAPKRRRGLAAGAIALLVLAVLAAAYFAAAALAEAVPALEAPLGAYIEAVDDARSAIGVGPAPGGAE